MWAMSDSEISVPIESSAAALMVASRSSGRRISNDVEAAFVRKPMKASNWQPNLADAGSAYPYALRPLRRRDYRR